MGKIVEIRELYNEKINDITKSEDNWLSFLKTASWNFKYSFNDQILIYAQRPNATACADMATWNNKVHRWVNKGADYIFVFSKDENSKYPFELVFDVADTHNYRNTPYKLWDVKPEYETEIIESLEAKFGEVGENNNLVDTIMATTNNMVVDNIQDYMSSITKYKQGTMLENLSDEEITPLVYQTVFSSVAYMILNRCGINPEDYIAKTEFSYINKFDNSNLTVLLGTAISDIAEMGLREIAKTVINLQKEEKNQNRTFVNNQKEEYSNSKENIKGGNEYDRNRIQESRGLQYAQPNNDTRETTNREIRTNEATLSKEQQERGIHNTTNELQTSRTFEGNTRNSNENDKTNSRENGETRGNNRRIETGRPNDLDKDDEQLQVDSRRTDNERTNLQLEILTEEEQKQNIAEAENASVFSFTQEMIDSVLQEGSHIQDGKFRIYEQFSKSLSSSENAEFLKSEYGIGGRSADHNGIVEDHNAKGIVLSTGRGENEQILRLTWLQVEKRIRELISIDRYLSEIEKDEYYDWLDANDRPQINNEIENQIKDEEYELAEKLHSFIKDYDFYSYIDNVPMGNTDEENIELIRADINDELNIKDYIDFLKATMEDIDYDEEEAVVARELLVELEKRLPYYEFNIGDIVYIGTQQYEIRAVDDNRVILIDTSFPLLTKEMERREFDRKVKENPANDKLRNERIIQKLKTNEEKYTEQNKAVDYYVGKTVYLESDKKFKINKIDNDKNIIELLDLQLATFMPIFREESVENFERLYYENPLNNIEKEQATVNDKTNEQKETTETIVQTPTSQDKFIPNVKRKRRNKIEYFDLHPEIPLKDRNNYKITDNALGEGTKKEKYKRNIEAIKVLEKCEQENRYATIEEQEILSQYVGWGGIPEAFDKNNDDWTREYNELSSLLTEKEYKEAKQSTLTSFYTPPIAINAIYKTLAKMGLSQGNILEPSCGTGNFMGMLPEELKKCKMYGIEIDGISGRIARQLYQKNTIAVKGFEEIELPDSFFDVAVGNVPFGDYKLYDKRYDKNKFQVHDYFFAKALDKVRPNGVIAFITSRGTMDKENEDIRKYICQRAELIAAIRLPNNTFKKNAGTEVTSDIIFLKKRDKITDIEDDWVELAESEDGIRMNKYFVDHPEMILGKMEMTSGRFGLTPTCMPYEIPLENLLDQAIININSEIEDYQIDLEDEEEKSIPADPSVRNFSYTIVDNQIYYRENSRMYLQDIPVTATSRIKGMIAIRDCVRNLIELQTDNASEDEIKQEQIKLNSLYDSFTKTYGIINSRGNENAFSDDSSYYLLCSLEIIDENKKFIKKADMFTKRTIKPHKAVTEVSNSIDALIVSISEKARVDIEYMCNLTGKTEQELVKELEGSIYKDPMKEIYVTADEYLSGNVREKLKIAEEFAKNNPEYEKNVDSLKKVKPQDLSASEISIRLGATWIPTEIIEQFIFELLKPNSSNRDRISVHYSDYTSEWNIVGKSEDRGNILAYSTYGTTRANAYRIIETTLNLKDVRITDTVIDENGNEQKVLNAKETAIAQAKQEKIKEEFLEWIWKDQSRRERLVKIYNEKFNSIKPREFDGQYIQFGGINPEITLRKHQIDAIAHILYGGNTLLAHEVGAGKTFEMVASAMESKRLGLCSKSLFVVPNHIIEQFASEFLQLYPSANILVATKKDFATNNRKKFCSKIATGEYDAIIIGHSQFEKIPMSKERQEKILNKQIEDLTLGINDLKNNDGEYYSVKQLEKSKKKIEEKLKKLNDQSRKDDIVTFEQLGCDRIFIDEAHYFKNLFLFTKMRNVGGIAQTEAQKSSDLFMKCQYLDELTEGRGIVFATGTPISNSMVEMYTMQRYLQYNTLEKADLLQFDSWASTFGETVSAIELNPTGTGFRSKTRFAKFYNLPELMSMFKEIADIQTAETLKLPVPKANYKTVVVKPSEIQKEMVKGLGERAERIRKKLVNPKEDNMLNITNEGRKLALDQRIINPMLQDFKDSKVNVCANNVYEIWEQNKDKKSTQLVFCDLSTPKPLGTMENPYEMEEIDGKWQLKEWQFTDVYTDLKRKLIERGIPADEIAFIHDANTETKKKELFAKVRKGDVRVLIGSTSKMGAGTNVQDKIKAIHHLDVPYRPSDLQQQDGRRN